MCAIAGHTGGVYVSKYIYKYTDVVHHALYIILYTMCLRVRGCGGGSSKYQGYGYLLFLLSLSLSLSLGK